MGERHRFPRGSAHRRATNLRRCALNLGVSSCERPRCDCRDIARLGFGLSAHRIAVPIEDSSGTFELLDGRMPRGSLSSEVTQCNAAVVPERTFPVRTPGLVMPHVLREVRRSYTQAAIQRKAAGTMWVEVLIDEKGRVLPLYVSLDRDLDRQAVAAAG
jgi:hypothetical protein